MAVVLVHHQRMRGYQKNKRNKGLDGFCAPGLTVRIIFTKKVSINDKLVTRYGSMALCETSKLGSAMALPTAERQHDVLEVWGFSVPFLSMVNIAIVVDWYK